MEMRPGELIDRYTVAKLYTEREDSGQEELKRLTRGIEQLKLSMTVFPWDGVVDLMYRVNGFIWDFESPIHTGKMDMDPMMAGVLALRVRKLNVMRTSLSKLINTLVEE